MEILKSQRLVQALSMIGGMDMFVIILFHGVVYSTLVTVHTSWRDKLSICQIYQ